MVIVGLTGSIGMGKSTVAKRIRERGVPVIDADALVHDLYRGAAVAAVEAAFPGVAVAGAIDRGRLAAQLGSDRAAFKRLEAIVHPLVRAAERDLLLKAEAQGARLAVLEIPLLYESGGERLVDAVIVVSAPADVQRARVLERPGMSEEKLAVLIGRQVPDEEKRRRADFVVDTGAPLPVTLAQVDGILDSCVSLSPQAIERWRT